MATELNRRVLADTTGTAVGAFHRDYFPGAPFYRWREDAALLRTAVAAAGGGADVLWGLDYDIVGDRYALRRLRDIAPNAAARAAAENAIARADSALAQALATQNPGLLMMFGGADDWYAPLRQAYAPEPGGEADRIIRLLQETREINAYWGRGQGYLSNHHRAQSNKRQFMRYLRQATERTGPDHLSSVEQLENCRNDQQLSRDGNDVEIERKAAGEEVPGKDEHARETQHDD